MGASRNPRDLLILYTRYPEAGQVKTRLIASLGRAGATAVHRRLTAEVLATARAFCAEADVALEVHHSGGAAGAMSEWLGPNLEFREQTGQDLGARLAHSFSTAFDDEVERVVVIGSDCVELTVRVLTQAFATLEREALVLGPAADGGYYLIGLARSAGSDHVIRDLLRDICWGGDRVLKATIANAERLGITVALLKPLHDIDRPEDLVRLERGVDERDA
jgi:rSAM/selenodomain-associated transferase 1